jgi:protein-tyrosine phosphatase
MEELGIDIHGHRARQVDEAMIRDADLVLAMTPRHRETLHRNFPGFREKIRTIPEYSAGDTAAGIADPYGYDYSVYRTSAREILRHMESVLERLDLEYRAPGV